MGFVVVAPLAVFWLCDAISNKLALRVFVLFALGGIQGVLGWLMVASGLVDNPEVSPYRLSAHLITAFIILGGFLWLGLDESESRVRAPNKGFAAPFVLLLLTITWGGLVAGT